MEWELSSDGLSKADKRTAEIIIDQFFGVHTFRVEELVFPECNDDSLNEVVRSSKNMTGFKLSRRLGIIISGECLVPKVAHDFMKKSNDGTTWNVTTLIMKETRPMQQSLLQQNFYRLNVHYEKDYSCRAKYRSTYQKYETENVKREVDDDDIVGYVSESKCGYTIQKTHATHENELIEEIDATRNKKDTVTKSTPNDSTVTQEAIVTEKHTATQVPTVTEKVKEPEAPEEDTVTHLPTVTEENVVTQDAPVSEDAKEPTVTQIPTLTEEVKEPLMIQESTVTQHQEAVESPSLLKYLLVLIVIPIVLAIIFAFF
ncbi:hypothetical protein CAEBREN_20206 [Caenorhabditis brenneri]|uniref:Uncharacterized protein n=1 Tax=Caenorhabditis brenneri TaxID=135651 RepID=G0NI97_CAEBE|nr:hypothetical protein CAEBREN_20206 [Caenorhabditis brenneri]